MIKQKIKSFYVKNERYLTPIAFLTGFLWDSFTLQRIDLWLENIIFIVYLFAAAGIILLLNSRFPLKHARYLPIALQFIFGALFSGFFIFYSRSASFFTSWPFLFILIGILVGNEFFRKHYHQLTFQLSIFFIAIFSYSIFSVPVFLGEMGPLVFILSGIVSLFLIGLVIFILSRVVPQKIGQRQRVIAASILGLFLAFNFLYFTNIIPPIPLSLKDAGVYYSIKRISPSEYAVYQEKSSWPDFLRVFDKTISWSPGTPIYVYSAVFAPTKISTEIFHHWSYFDEKRDNWTESSRAGFLITGGRDGGYRGYTFKSYIWPGKWRVEIVNDRGQVLGRVGFKLVETEVKPQLEIKIK